MLWEGHVDDGRHVGEVPAIRRSRHLECNQRARRQVLAHLNQPSSGAVLLVRRRSILRSIQGRSFQKWPSNANPVPSIRGLALVWCAQSTIVSSGTLFFPRKAVRKPKGSFWCRDLLLCVLDSRVPIGNRIHAEMAQARIERLRQSGVPPIFFSTGWGDPPRLPRFVLFQR